MLKIAPSEITPEHTYLSRRKFMAGAGALAGTMALAACSNLPTPGSSSNAPDSGAAVSESIEKVSQSITDLPEALAHTDKNFTQEERIYRLRCVEAWSMVVPWVGFSLGDLLKEADPTSDAKYVHFTTVQRPEEMPGQNRNWIDWPYVEGLRVDEAMHSLTMLATGMYGKPLPNQNGAPIRLVVPWKYGFKSIKSIVKIELTDTMPTSTWMDQASHEYGFYANVNPEVSHPRWTQATERRIGEFGRRDTLMFNGYGEEVASLYTGMDLTKNF